MDSTNRAERPLNASFAAADDKAVLNTPAKSTIPSSTGGASPTMTRFLSSHKSSSGTKKGYYGSYDFLNSLNEFRLTFGHYPIILANSPNDTITEMTSKRIVRNYDDQCKLEIFMHLCRLHYIEHTKVDVELKTMEVCNHFTKRIGEYQCVIDSKEG